MENQILELLRANSRLSYSDIANRTGMNVQEVERLVSEMEKKGIIKGYTAILNDSAESDCVKALIEVKVTPRREGGFDQVAKRIAKFPEVNDVSLVSGAYDLLLTVRGKNLQEVACFVADKLATIDGVNSTSTAFMLKKYKESGHIMEEDEEYERLKVCF